MWFYETPCSCFLQTNNKQAKRHCNTNIVFQLHQVLLSDSQQTHVDYLKEIMNDMLNMAKTQNIVGLKTTTYLTLSLAFPPKEKYVQFLGT